jgi:deoxyribodipyrimidine photo-lyase
MSYRVVWFKRDLRWQDHAALAEAARLGPVLCLYIVEPSLWREPDAARQHLEFIRESLRELHRQLRAQGGGLHLMVGEATEALARLHAARPFASLHSHEETGNSASYERDKAVARWCRAQGLAWTEHQGFGVQRRLASRNQWAGQWEAHMAQPLAQPGPMQFAPAPCPADAWPSLQDLGLDGYQPPARQLGGRSLGLHVLQDFLALRSGQYRGGISSPLSAPSACSRLSPYLSYGCLSLREVVQATQGQLCEIHGDPRHRARQAGLENFLSRLHWHCHFIQKLESEPEIEWRNMHRGYDGLREDAFNPAHFEALQAGRTGWPLVDACVAMLRETGWINFRMRAMLVSVAAYPLWLHWRPVGQWLARQFLDYEPGIHWSQMQMQSGTTGINLTRVYNPIKQAKDHDPQGRFVRQWLPGLRRVPDAWLFEPWRMPAELQERCGARLGQEIALPPVDLALNTRAAKDKMHGLRRQAQVQAGNAQVIDKHASRASRHRMTDRQKSASRPPAPARDQLSLDL